jgi:CSLREA domain-containing protein
MLVKLLILEAFMSGLRVFALAVATLAIVGGLQTALPTEGTILPQLVTKTPDTNDGLCDADCSLREAITVTNLNPSLDVINFNIPATDPGCDADSGVCTIAPASALPTVTDPLIINGFTQPGASANTNGPGQGINAIYQIELDGTNTGSLGTSAALTISAGNSTVSGLVINRAASSGIRLTTNGNNTIAGNIIGLDPTGGIDLGNGIDGIVAASDGNMIGGATPADRNLISGNEASGVNVFNASDNVLLGNLIGTDAAGTAAIPNLRGIRNFGSPGSPNTVIGGALTGERNVISGNSSDGILISSGDGVVVRGNVIGLGVDDLTPLGNGGNGITHGVQDGTAQIGGPAAGEGNIIANNANFGISVTSSGSKVPILGNSVFANGSMGLDISPGPGAPNVNDPDDADTGPNQLQNHPVITGVFPGSSTVIEGSLDSTPSTQFRLEFFSNDDCDSNNHGEGKTFLGFADATTDANGDIDFSVTLAPTVSAAATITATATDPDGNTSEFSHCYADPLKGDVDCSGAINSVDSLKLLRFGAALTVAQTEPCPNIGAQINAIPEDMGDINCNGPENSVDALLILRHNAGLSVNLAQGCRAIGTVGGTVITALDFSWQPDALSAKKGRLVGLAVKNDGAFPHALRIAGADNTFGNGDDALGEPANTAPGFKSVVTWETPDQVTAIQFRCDIHPQMTGTINLK